MAALNTPLVAMAAAYDYGDYTSPLGNIHPEYKGPVGKRLSYAARALAYGETSLAYKNPKFLYFTNRQHHLDLVRFQRTVQITKIRDTLKFNSVHHITQI